MRQLRFLLRPGWLALVAGVLVFAGACFWLLSPWQFGRNAERQAQIDSITNAQHHPPILIQRMLPEDTEPTGAQEWHRITVSGRFIPADDIVVRLREVDSCEDCDPSPVYEILTPFQPDEGKPLLVDRGYVQPNNNQVPGYQAAPRGHVSVIARVHPDEPDSHRAPITNGGYRQVYDINSTVIGGLTGLRMRPGYFELVENQPGGLGVQVLPQLDSGPFLGYAWQWIAFGVMAIGALGYFTWRELKPGGALTGQGRARRCTEKAAPKPRGRHAVAALIAEDEAREEAERRVPSS